MEAVIINNYEEFESYLGKEIGVSDYLQITQEQVNAFGRATHDMQWIHTDPERAKLESPFKGTIAHGYLTLSLLAYFWARVVEVRNFSTLVNYGVDKFKFSEPVMVGSNVRVRFTVETIANLRGIAKVSLKVRMEIEDKKKPAFEGIVTFLYNFKN